MVQNQATSSKKPFSTKKALLLIAGLFLLVGIFYVVITTFGKSEDSLPEFPEVSGSALTEVITPSYATGFSLGIYEDGTVAVSIEGEEECFLVETPYENIYQAATGGMSLIYAIGAKEQVAFASLVSSDWNQQEVADDMAAGEIRYAGKYSAPDYELLLSGDCDLVVENTMIYHTPEVKEKLEELGMTVLVDKSGYEDNPLGRMEWVLVYGALTGHLPEAQTFFESQASVVEDLLAETGTAVQDGVDGGKTAVAFFYISTKGTAVVRRGNDYVATMLEMAGGDYVFSEITGEDDENSGTVNISMEEFYELAKDADILIYNNTISKTDITYKDLLEKSELFSEFQAVQNKQVYVTTPGFYQRTDCLGEMILELSEIFSHGASGDEEAEIDAETSLDGDYEFFQEMEE